jgi:LacI family transcriptional regulator
LSRASVRAVDKLLAGLDLRQLNVPRDLSVVTVDAEEAEFRRPALTAVRLPFQELGTVAVQEMHRILPGESPRDVVVAEAPELVWRASVASVDGASSSTLAPSAST